MSSPTKNNVLDDAVIYIRNLTLGNHELSDACEIASFQFKISAVELQDAYTHRYLFSDEFLKKDWTSSGEK